MNINDISKYMTFLKNSVKECIEKNDKESAKQINEIINLIRDYVKVLYLENRYKEIEIQMNKSKAKATDIIEQEIQAENAKFDELIDQADPGDLDVMITLKSKIQELKLKKQKQAERFSKLSFLNNIKTDEMIIDKTLLIQRFLELSSVKGVLNSDIDLIKDGSLNIPVISFLTDILNYDLADYKRLSVIKEKNDRIKSLENEIRGLKGYTSWIKSIIVEYNKCIKSYGISYKQLSSLLEEEKKYKKLFKYLPFLRFFIVDKEKREDVDSINNDLNYYFSRINEFCCNLSNCPRIEIDSIKINNVDSCNYYGKAPLKCDFNIGNKKYSYYKYTDYNLIDISLLDGLTDREMMEPLAMEVLDLKNEINTLYQQLPVGISKLNPNLYTGFVKGVLDNNELSPEYKMVQMVLNALLFLNRIDGSFEDIFVSEILRKEESLQFKQQTNDKIKQYTKELNN